MFSLIFFIHPQGKRLAITTCYTLLAFSTQVTGRLMLGIFADQDRDVFESSKVLCVASGEHVCLYGNFLHNIGHIL